MIIAAPTAALPKRTVVAQCQWIICFRAAEAVLRSLRTSALPAIVAIYLRGSRTEAIDPLSSEVTPLFHPRRDRWGEHFAWDEASLRIWGLTPIGRATATALNMNNDVILDARRNWVRIGWRPDIPGQRQEPAP